MYLTIATASSLLIWGCGTIGTCPHTPLSTFNDLVCQQIVIGFIIFIFLSHCSICRAADASRSLWQVKQSDLPIRASPF